MGPSRPASVPSTTGGLFAFSATASSYAAMTSPSATRLDSRVKMRAVKSEAPVTMSPFGRAATDQTEIAGC